MEGKYIFLGTLILLYVCFTIRFQNKILRNKVLTRKQKVINTVMVWCIPFVWYFFISEFIDDKMETMTIKKRKKLLKKDGGGFYESGIGMSSE